MPVIFYKIAGQELMMGKEEMLNMKNKVVNYDNNLSNLLIELDLVDNRQLKEIYEIYNKSNKDLDQILIESGYINRDQLKQIKNLENDFVDKYLTDDLKYEKETKYMPEDLNNQYNKIIEDLSEFKESEEHRVEEVNLIKKAPIVRLVNMIIRRGMQVKASDIHIEPQAENIRVRYRIDGVLKEELELPKYSLAALISRLKIIADLDITNHHQPQDGRVEIEIEGKIVDMRISTIPVIYGEKAVIRIFTRNTELINIQKLGFSRQNLKLFKKLLNNKNGIILLTGPTGSGKSTTLFAALKYLNIPERNIVTIEDPVEYRIKGINQIQAAAEKGLTFARTLRAILRQDPDIIMIGEIRDKETAKIAVRAALTGHLVLSTLHTNDSVSSISRLIDMGIPAYLVANTVKGIIAQRLIRKLCNNCKQKVKADFNDKKLLNKDIKYIYKETGCKHCYSSGYRGRVAVQEIFEVDSQIKKMIIKKLEDNQIKKRAVKQGMNTLLEDGIAKMKKGITSREELIRVIL